MWEGLTIEIDYSLPSQRVIRCLKQLIEYRGKPQMIRSDNGPEYISHELEQWLAAEGIDHEFIEPGKPQQNAYVERYNRTVRYDWLNQHLFGCIVWGSGSFVTYLRFFCHKKYNRESI